MLSNARKVFSHLPPRAKAIASQRSLPCSPQGTSTFDGSQIPRQHSRLTEICPLPSFLHSFSSSPLCILCSSFKCPEHLCFFPMFRFSPATSYSIPIFYGVSFSPAASRNDLCGSAQCLSSECLLSAALLWRLASVLFSFPFFLCLPTPDPRAREMAMLISSLSWVLHT